MVGTLTPVVDVPAQGQPIALPGGGYAVAAPSEEGDSIVIQPYDSIGRATGQPIIAASDLPENWQLNTFGVSSDGSRFVVVWNGYELGDGGVDVLDASYTAQVIGANGQPIGDPIELGLSGEGKLPPVGRSVVALPNDGFAILGHQNYIGPTELVLHILPATGGAASGPLTVGVNFEVDGHAAPPAEALAVNGELLLITSAKGEGPTLRRFTEDGEAVGEPVPLVHASSEPAGPYTDIQLSDAVQLANGDLLVAWTNYSGGPKFTPYLAVSTDFQRYDPSGNPVGETVTTEPAVGLASLQDGGFVVLQRPAYQDYQGDLSLHVFDARGNLVGEPLATNGGTELVAQADGTVLVAGGDGSSIFDYAPSHTAEWGGNSTYIATWQEQEAISREGGIDFLRSDAGVAMKPWIVNFEAASDADGINATANDMANHLLGGNGANVFIAGAGNDKLYGLGGNDWLLGEDGNDLLDGGAGHDVLIGGLGNDSIAAGAGADTVAGDQGDDAIGGGAGDDIVQGGAGRDFVNGDAGNDTLAGGAGRDWLHGGSGDDIVSGDRGADTLEGGSGADQFRFGANSGNDRILDFEYGAAGDRIVIDLPANGTLNGLTIDTAAALFDAAEDTDDGVLIGLGEGHSILLVGWQKADLGTDLFLLV